MQIGQIVYSKAGRDKGKVFVVLSLAGEYAQLADGKSRTLEKPKKKKLKHLQINNDVVKLKGHNGKQLLDADIRKLLLPYQKEVRLWQRTT